MRPEEWIASTTTRFGQSVNGLSLLADGKLLRDEIEAGRIPSLIAGRSVLVHVPTVAALLAERAKGESEVARG
jgi:hypothetical protein